MLSRTEKAACWDRYCTMVCFYLQSCMPWEGHMRRRMLSRVCRVYRVWSHAAGLHRGARIVHATGVAGRITGSIPIPV